METSRRAAAGFSGVQIASVYVGAVIGAGFASGQEVLQFFGVFGAWGALGIAVAAFLFFAFAALILTFSQELQARTHRELVHRLAGPWVGRFLDAVIAFFLFGGLGTMAAGAGATLDEFLGLSPLWGRAALLLLVLVPVLSGAGGVVSSFTLLVPFLLLVVLGIGGFSLVQGSLTFAYSSPEAAPVPWWPLSSVVYASYNLAFAVAVLAPLARRAKRRALVSGAGLGALALGVGLLVVYGAVLAQMPEAGQVEIPMMIAARKVSPAVSFLYVGALLAAIYTTAVADLYGLAVRVAEEDGPWFRPAACLLTAGAFAVSGAGFSQLVAKLYSGVGYAGLVLLLLLARAGFEKYLRPALGQIWKGCSR